MALIKCRECGGTLSNRAASCPHCGAPNQKKPSGCAGIAVFIALAIVAFGWLGNHSSHAGRTPEEKCNDRVAAFVMANQFVEDRLTSPSTAKHPNYTDSGVSIRSTGQCSHSVDSYVDSQNVYGAMIRKRYHAELKNKIGTDTWELTSLRFTN